MNQSDASVPDGLFHALSDSRRRIVLAYLLDTTVGAATFDELVDAVIESETRSPGRDRESVEISLYHHHLGLLAENGLIEHEQDRGVVRTTDRTRQVEHYFDFITEPDPLHHE